MGRPSPLVVFVLATALGQPAVGQTAPDREAVRAAVLDYVEGFYEGDTTRLVRSVRPQVIAVLWQSPPPTNRR